MRYGKFTEGKWTIEFRFNWRHNKYDVIAYQGPRQETKDGISGEKIGAVWKDPRKSRRKPSWSAIQFQKETEQPLEQDFPQMRQAGLALLEQYQTHS